MYCFDRSSTEPEGDRRILRYRFYVHHKVFNTHSSSNRSTRTRVITRAACRDAMSTLSLELCNIGVGVPGGGGDIICTVSVTVAPGEVVFVSGPSGSGKSLLLRAVALLDNHIGGELRLQGKTSSQWGVPAWRARVSYVAQSKPSLGGTPVDLFNTSRSFAAQRERLLNNNNGEVDTADSLPAIASRLGISPALLDKTWDTLSGGEAQRALLAVHLALRPDFLLLDESTSACDAVSAAAVERELAACGEGLLWVTHDPQQLERVGGRILRFPTNSSSLEV